MLDEVDEQEGEDPYPGFCKSGGIGGGGQHRMDQLQEEQAGLAHNGLV